MAKKEEIKEALQEETEERCPKCGRELVVKWGRNGRFIACTGYPECKYTQPFEDVVTPRTEESCGACGAPMVVKVGRYGRFLACSNYPDCKFTKPLSTGIQCPEEGCEGVIVERRSRRGKTFFGCSEYPGCRFATWYRPVPVECPECHHPYLEEKTSRAKGTRLQCPKCKAIVQKEGEQETGEKFSR